MNHKQEDEACWVRDGKSQGTNLGRVFRACDGWMQIDQQIGCKVSLRCGVQKCKGSKPLYTNGRTLEGSSAIVFYSSIFESFSESWEPAQGTTRVRPFTPYPRMPNQTSVLQTISRCRILCRRGQRYQDATKIFKCLVPS